MIPYTTVYYGLSSTNLFTPITKLSIFLYVYITETEGDIMNSNKVNYKNMLPIYDFSSKISLLSYK